MNIGTLTLWNLRICVIFSTVLIFLIAINSLTR